jgi:hypothetical protein
MLQYLSSFDVNNILGYNSVIAQIWFLTCCLFDAVFIIFLLVVHGLSRHKCSLEEIGFEDKSELLHLFASDIFRIILNDGVTVNCLIFS